jgi:DNA modification methylase
VILYHLRMKIRKRGDEMMPNQIITGDCIEVLRLLPADYIQCVVTSPPYYALRDYGVAGQIGLEASLDEYLTRIVEVFREVRRVLRPDGTLWLNIGDSYAGAGKGGGGSYEEDGLLHSHGTGRRVPDGMKPKDLMGVPWRVAFALQADGWYLRSDIIWHKPNAMPESAGDRPTTSHEYLFLLSKQGRYFYDAAAIREENSPTSSGNRNAFRGTGVYTHGQSFDNGNTAAPNVLNGLSHEWTGRNKRTVWSIATRPFRGGAHFATMPPALVEPCILAGTAPRTCEQCGTCWRRMRESTEQVNQRKPAHVPVDGATQTSSTRWVPTMLDTDIWKPDCTCSKNTGAGRSIILDPFMGAGTVALVALQQSRNYLGIEINPEYVQLAQERIAEVQPVLWSTAANCGVA